MTLQVGQCGNQVGCRFWDLILREHVLHNRVGMFNQALSAYFTDADARYGASSQDARALRARAVLVDMEEGVVAAALRGPLRTLFDRRQIVTNVSGSGNNWAHGMRVRAGAPGRPRRGGAPSRRKLRLAAVLLGGPFARRRHRLGARHVPAAGGKRRAARSPPLRHCGLPERRGRCGHLALQRPPGNRGAH